jgi:ABC-type polysaccharide/polyol phosphate export permease
MLSPLFRYRSLIWRHSLADIRHRYAGSGMGVVWNVIQPLSLIVVYAVVFTGMQGMKQNKEAGFFSFAIFLCTGFFPWIAFSDCVSRGCNAFSSNAGYLKKLPIPEQVFVAQAAVTATITLVISFFLLIGIALLSGGEAGKPRVEWLMIPLPLMLLVATGFGFGLILATLQVFFNDIAQLLGIVMQVAFWLTPIVYQSKDMPALLQPIILAHPATPAIESVRGLFFHGTMPTLTQLSIQLAWAVVTITLGLLVLRALRSEIRDVL